MCYFHTSSTISCKLKCDISRFTHCIHEEMRSGCVYLQILCENKDNLLLAAVVGDGDGGAGMAGGWRPGAPGAAWSPLC